MLNKYKYILGVILRMLPGVTYETTKVAYLYHLVTDIKMKLYQQCDLCGPYNVVVMLQIFHINICKVIKNN